MMDDGQSGGAKRRDDIMERAVFDCCPFCGGVGVPYNLTDPSEFTAVCEDCGSSCSIIIVNVEDDPLPALEYVWNRRDFPLNRAAQDVLHERMRQIGDEGWTPEHDDAHHRHGELAGAAACYALAACDPPAKDVMAAVTAATITVWPWDTAWFKPGDKRTALVKAGALILAEIERLDRAAALDEQPF